MCHKQRGHYAWITQDINSCRKWNTIHNLAVNEPCSEPVIFCTTRVAFYSSVQNGTDPWYLHLSFFCAYFTVQRFRVHNVSLVITTDFTWNMYARKKSSVNCKDCNKSIVWDNVKFYSKSETMLVKHTNSPVWTTVASTVHIYCRSRSLKASPETSISSIFSLRFILK